MAEHRSAELSKHEAGCSSFELGELLPFGQRNETAVDPIPDLGCKIMTS
jgi:hypothetical protein